MIKFSIIMQSTMRDYPGAACKRDLKLQRAIESVLSQTHKQWELIIVADNCKQTKEIAETYKDKRIKSIQHNSMAQKWSSSGRNVGKDAATGQYILYLDNDDYMSKNYLTHLHGEIIKDNLDWYYADHYEIRQNKWQWTRSNLISNSAGTANIVHSAKLKSNWQGESRYGSEDWIFIKRLMNESKRFRHIDLAGYFICHIRGRYDV